MAFNEVHRRPTSNDYDDYDDYDDNYSYPHMNQSIPPSISVPRDSYGPLYPSYPSMDESYAPTPQERYPQVYQSIPRRESQVESEFYPDDDYYGRERGSIYPPEPGAVVGRPSYGSYIDSDPPRMPRGMESRFSKATEFGDYYEPRISGERDSRGRIAGRRSLIDESVGPSRVIDSRIVGERISGVYENELAPRFFGTRPEPRTSIARVETYDEEPVIQERIVEKPVEIIKERKVQVERYVDVPYDVIVERPIEKVIEKEVIHEKTVEVPIEKVVEVEVPRYVEVPYEKIVEKPVEVERYVDVPYERVVEYEVDDVHENIFYDDHIQEVDVEDLPRWSGHQMLPREIREVEVEKVVEVPVYYDNIIEEEVEVPVEKYIERPVERIIEKPVEKIIERPVYRENIIERRVEVPVERIVEKPVEKIVEVEVYYDNIIEKPVPRERIVERRIEVPVEKIVERPRYVENIVERPVERVVENRVMRGERVSHHPIENLKEKRVAIGRVIEEPVERVIERPLPIERVKTIPVEYIVDRDVPVLVENMIQLEIPELKIQRREKRREETLEVERITEVGVPIEKIKNVPVERIREVMKIIENIVEVEVPIEKIIEKKVERIVPKYIDVEVEKIIEVPVATTREIPIANEHYSEEDVQVDRHVGVERREQVETIELEKQSDSLNRDLAEKKRRLQTAVLERKTLREEVTKLQQRMQKESQRGDMVEIVKENAKLRSQMAELMCRKNILEKDRERMRSDGPNKTSVEMTVQDPKVDGLRKELRGLLRENERLIAQIGNMKTKSDF